MADPNYPAPCGGIITFSATVGAAGCLEDRTAVYGLSHRTTATRSGDTCTLDPLAPADPANDRLPTGRYQNIRVDNGECLVFDPTFDQKAGRENGIVYITGTLDVNNGGLVLGDGVTLVFARGARLNMNAGATISLNRGSTTNNPFGAAACGGNPTGSVPNNCRFAAWTAKAGGGGQYTWGTGISTSYSTPSDPFERGMAAYVCKSAADCDSNGAPSTDILQLNAGAGIDWRGLVYAPYDNVKLAGQPGHQDIGQLSELDRSVHRWIGDHADVRRSGPGRARSARATTGAVEHRIASTPRCQARIRLRAQGGGGWCLPAAPDDAARIARDRGTCLAKDRREERREAERVGDHRAGVPAAEEPEECGECALLHDHRFANSDRVRP